MAWIWALPPDNEISVYGEYDHRRSTLRSSYLLSQEPIDPGLGAPVLQIEGYSLERVLEYACLPTTSGTPVVNHSLESQIAIHVDASEVQFLPVKVVAANGETDCYSFVIPLKWVTCTDIKRSEITGWIVPGKSADMYKSLRHVENCLGALQIARDTITKHVIVSDRMRSMLLSTQSKGLAFLPPEKVHSAIY